MALFAGHKAAHARNDRLDDRVEMHVARALRHVSGKGPWTRGKKSPIEPRVPTESVTARIPVNADPCDV